MIHEKRKSYFLVTYFLILLYFFFFGINGVVADTYPINITPSNARFFASNNSLYYTTSFSDLTSNYRVFHNFSWSGSNNHITGVRVTYNSSQFSSWVGKTGSFNFYFYTTLPIKDVILNFGTNTNYVCNLNLSSVPNDSDSTSYHVGVVQCDNVYVSSPNLYLDLFTYQNYISSSIFGISDIFTFITSSSSDIINNQNENTDKILDSNSQTQDKIDSVNDSLNDSSVDSSQASGFFSNFNDTDHGGISGVVSAPLNFVRSLTNSCQPMVFTLFDTDISVPCGDTLFWGRSDVATFRTTWNILFGGAFVFILLKKVFKTIENMKDPNNDKIEVMDL